MLVVVENFYAIKIYLSTFILNIFLHLFKEEVIASKPLPCLGQLLEHSGGVSSFGSIKVSVTAF
jgi:hypothetical protein